MGLLDKAKSDREAGRPKGGAGLFSRAQAARASDEERTVPPFPYSSSDLREFSHSLASGPRGKDWLASAYEELVDTLELETLALVAFCEDGAYLAAGWGGDSPQSGCSSREFFRFDDSLLGGSECGPIPRSAAESLPPLFNGLDAESARASLSRDGDGSPQLLWLYADSRLAGDSERMEALDTLFRSLSPAGDLLASPKALKLDAALAILPPASGKAFAFLLSLPQYEVSLVERIPGLTAMAIDSLLLGASREILGSQGTAFLIEGGKLLALLPCRQAADAELGLVQFTKSLKRSLPFMTAASFPKAKAISLDYSDGSALHRLETFASE